jgi:hypothetical protein
MPLTVPDHCTQIVPFLAMPHLRKAIFMQLAMGYGFPADGYEILNLTKQEVIVRDYLPPLEQVR